MANIAINYQSKTYYPVFGCQSVAICLDASWGAKTVSSAPIVIATLKNSGRFLGKGGSPTVPPWENPRGEEYYQYSLVYDDTQITDPVTDVITCADISSLIDACLADKVIDIYQNQTPWVEGSGVVYLETLTDDVGIGTSTPIADLDVVGSVTGSVLAVAATYPVTLDDRIIVADATAGNIDINLPTAASAYNADGTGIIYTIKRDAVDVSVNTVTINPDGIEVIDNAASKALGAAEVVTIVSDGTSWHIIGN